MHSSSLSNLYMSRPPNIQSKGGPSILFTKGVTNVRGPPQAIHCQSKCSNHQVQRSTTRNLASTLRFRFDENKRKRRRSQNIPGKSTGSRKAQKRNNQPNIHWTRIPCISRTQTHLCRPPARTRLLHPIPVLRTRKKKARREDPTLVIGQHCRDLSSSTLATSPCPKMQPGG